jgi:predicted transcriptional regulator
MSRALRQYKPMSKEKILRMLNIKFDAYKRLIAAIQNYQKAPNSETMKKMRCLAKSVYKLTIRLPV